LAVRNYERMAKMKQCTRCKRWKDESEFSRQSRSKDGLRYWCKKCESEYERKRYRKVRKVVKEYYRYEESHRIVDGVKQKRCRRCRRWKAESEFYKTRRHKDGLAVWCKECSNKATNKARKKRRLAVRN